MSKTRTGKHKQGKVRMGVYVEPRRKAIAILTAQELDMTMTDLIWYGIEGTAKQHGILDNEGNVSEKYAAQMRMAEEIVKQSEVNG